VLEATLGKQTDGDLDHRQGPPFQLQNDGMQAAPLAQEVLAATAFVTDGHQLLAIPADAVTASFVPDL
jgi:hypothetical protein